MSSRSLGADKKEQNMQQKIEHEIKMREGAARLMVASKHPVQIFEAAKSLLSANKRILAFMSELQRQKTAEILGHHLCLEGNQLPCRAQLSLSDIRIPLMWRDTDNFRHKGDHRRFAVFCLLKVGTEIYDTSLVTEVDRSLIDITCDDVLLFNDVPHDFEMKLEVYCHKLHEETSVAHTPKKIRKKINDLSESANRSIDKRLSTLNEADLIGNMGVGPKFDLVARGSLCLADVSNSVKTFDLKFETRPDGQAYELPLFGHYCCQLTARPHCLTRPVVLGFLNVQMDEDLCRWRRYWCCLSNLQLACWCSPEDVEVTHPLMTIPVTKSTQICDADPLSSKKPHSFLIRTVNRGGQLDMTVNRGGQLDITALMGMDTRIVSKSGAVFDFMLAADSKADLNRWWEGFQQHLLDQALWKHACDEQMELKVPTRQKLPVFVRHSSLYEETPLIDQEDFSESLAEDVGHDQLAQMLQALVSEASLIRGGSPSAP